MDQTKVILDRDYQIAQVDPRLFGGFLEHIGRAVYEGVYEPQSKHADQYGFRKDVLNCLKQLCFTAMRYPGGNFASGYHWLDGVGPMKDRPRVQSRKRSLCLCSIATSRKRGRWNYFRETMLHRESSIP